MSKVKQLEPYAVPALIIAPHEPQLVPANYDLVEKTLAQWSERVYGMSLSEDNLDEVQTIKRAAVAVRNQLDAKVTETKRLYFNEPKVIFEARVRLLYGHIAQVEAKADEVLDKIEQERRGGINEILDHYKAKFQEQYQLDAEVFFPCIEYRKMYYNKGTDEKARKDDLEAQFKALRKEQDVFHGNVRMIKAACKDEPCLSVERYIRDLDFGKGRDVASIIDEIEAEKVRLRSIDSSSTQIAYNSVQDAEYSVLDTEKMSIEEKERLILAAPLSIDFTTDFPKRTKTMQLSVTYPCDLGDALTHLFKELKPYGIKIKQLKAEAVF